MKKFICISSILFLLDRISKILINKYVVNICIFRNFLYLDYVKNYGAAFGVLTNYQIFLIILGIIILIFLLYYIFKKKNYNLAYILLFTGIIGNLFDRIIYGYVIDFISFKLFNIYMPIFNFADIFIVLGAFLILIRSDKNEDNSR